MDHSHAENGKQLIQLGCRIHVRESREISEDLNENWEEFWNSSGTTFFLSV